MTYSNPLHQQLADQTQRIAGGSLLIGLILYWLGLEWPVVLISLAVTTILLPMPKLMSSWFSRLLVGLLVVYSLLQMSAALQFIIRPTGRFNLIMTIFVVLLGLLLALFGTSKPLKRKFVNFRDGCALTGCLFFIIPFTPILAGNHSMERIAKIGGVQIVDSIAHSEMISNYATTQNLGYKQSGYYPSGFQISTSIIQHSFFGSNENHSWRFHALLYFSDYLFFGVLLCLTLVYLGFAVLYGLGDKLPNRSAFLATGLTIGLSAAITNLFLFMNEGFLNYYYITAALFTGMLYLFEGRGAFGQLRSSTLADKWPLAAYLLLGVGASLSWPLLTLPILIGAGLWALPGSLKELQGARKVLAVANLPILFIVTFHVLALYFQLHYSPGGQTEIDAHGGIHSFNLPLLLIFILVFTVVICWKNLSLAFRKSLVAALLPYVILVVALMLLQFFLLGEARYYLMKCAEVMELGMVAITAAVLVHLLSRSGLDVIAVLVGAPTIMLFVILATIGTLPQPLIEARSLFRDYSKIGKPPYFDSDARLISDIGGQGLIDNFNVSIIHEDPSSHRFVAHVQTVSWAHIMSTHKNDAVAGKCFERQGGLLLNAIRDDSEQQSFIQIARACVDQATQNGRSYYIVTDQASVPKLKDVFGESVRLVY